MQSNHKLSHGKEVEAEGISYTDWKVKVNANSSLDVTNGTTITFLNGGNTTVSRTGNDITYNALPSLYEKINKDITASTYTLLSTDKTRWLVFKNNCTVTVPTGIVTPTLFEGEAFTGATVTFVAASGVVLRHTASINKTLSPNGVFGIRFQATNNCILFGTDPINYNA